MSLEEKAAITDLLYAYNTAVDVLDIDGWSACFTPDGVFHGAYDTFRAHNDKARFGQHARELEASGLPRLRHFLSNIRIDLKDDVAECHCFFQIIATPDQGPSTVAMVGEYTDRVIKLDGRWLFQDRVVSTDGGKQPIASGLRGVAR